METVLQLDNALNVRDLGGYPGKSGKLIRPQKLVRSGEIYQLTESDQQQLSDYHIKTIVDFRSPEERTEKPDQEIKGIQNVFLPIFPVDETMASISPSALFSDINRGFSGQDQMIKVYRSFVLEPAIRQAYREFLDVLLAHDDPNEAVLFHCTAGKDRTGFAAALIMQILDVDQRRIFENYLATNRYLKDHLKQVLDYAKKEGASDRLLTSIEDLMQAKIEYLSNSYISIYKEFGSQRRFLKDGLKVSDAEFEKLRAIYLL